MGVQRMEPACWSTSWPRNFEKFLRPSHFLVVTLRPKHTNSDTIIPAFSTRGLKPRPDDDISIRHLSPSSFLSCLFSQLVHELQAKPLVALDRSAGLKPAETNFRRTVAHETIWEVPRRLPIASTGVAYFPSTKPLPRRPTTCWRSFFNLKLSFQCGITYHGVVNSLGGMKCLGTVTSLVGFDKERTETIPVSSTKQ